MSDVKVEQPEEETVTAPPPTPAVEPPPPTEQEPPAATEEEPPEMAAPKEEEQEPQPQKNDPEHPELTKKFEKMNISLSIWPPTQRTRDAVITRLVETLSAPSILSKRYGSLPADEAASAARVIEEEAFGIANSAFSSSSESASNEDDGIEILQIYSKEISKRMLEAVKAKAAAASPADSEAKSVDAATPAESEEISSTVDSGSS